MSIYTANDHKSQDAYYQYLADMYNVHIETVHSLSDMLGEDEDFDGLVCALEEQWYNDRFPKFPC